MAVNTLSALVVGCSYARGHGLQHEENDPELWVNQLLKKAGYTHIDNKSHSGWNNESIFHATTTALKNNNYDLVIVAWSSIPRYNINIGLEWYTTFTMLKNSPDIGINNGKLFKRKYLDKLRNKLLELHNDHWDILKTVSYVNVLIDLQEKLRNGKIFFVNSLAPWSYGYFDKVAWEVPSEIDTYTQELLSADNRDDNEIKTLYNKIHNEYASAGGIQERYWLNLYNSLRLEQIDFVSDIDSHPGYSSQHRYADMLLPVLIEKLNDN